MSDAPEVLRPPARSIARAPQAWLAFTLLLVVVLLEMVTMQPRRAAPVPLPAPSPFPPSLDVLPPPPPLTSAR